MKKRVLVLTGGSDELLDETCTDDVKFSDVYHLTLKSKRNYAEKHGYDYMELRSFGSDYRNFFSNQQQGFLRAVKCFEMIEHYDAVMWIDGDSIITNDSFTIENFTDEQINFSASRDWAGVPIYNTGNFVINKNNNIDDFINMFYFLAKNLNTTNEQETFRAMFNFSLTHPKMKMLDYNYLNAVSVHQQECEVWHDRSKIANIWSENSFLVHFTGLRNFERIQIINKYFKEYV